MTRIIAVANQKGGVAKTTTVHSLGSALAERGRSVLLVDLDPQACLTYSTGTDPDGLDGSFYDVVMGRATLAQVLLAVEDMDLVPSAIDLAGAEVHLLTRPGREYVLERSLRPLVVTYDYILVDCPPSLGVLTINGLTAAGSVIIPLQCETLSHRGVGQLLQTVEDVKAFTNSELSVAGVVATMFEGRTRIARATLESIQSSYGLAVLEPPIPKSVRVAEAPGKGVSVLGYAPGSKAADAYRGLAANLDEAGEDPNPRARGRKRVSRGT